MRIIHNIYILRCSAALAQTPCYEVHIPSLGASDNSCQTMMATFNLDSRFKLEFPNFYNSTFGKLLPFRVEHSQVDSFDPLSRKDATIHCLTLKSTKSLSEYCTLI